MKLILIPLFILIMLALTIQMVNLFPVGNFDGHYSQDIPNSPFNLIFDISLTGGFIGLIIFAAVLGVFAGAEVEIFGSTLQLSETSQKIIYNVCLYGGLWGVFSTLSIIGVNDISLFNSPYGTFGYLILSLIYVMGVNAQINSSGDS